MPTRPRGREFEVPSFDNEEKVLDRSYKNPKAYLSITKKNVDDAGTKNNKSKNSRWFLKNFGTIVNKILRLPMPLYQTNPLSSVFPSSNNEGIRFIKRPWQSIIFETQPEAFFVLARRDYKLYANIGETVRTMKRFVVVIDTGAGSKFIRIHDLPQAMRRKIKKKGSVPNVINDSGTQYPSLRLSNMFYKSVKAHKSSTISW